MCFLKCAFVGMLQHEVTSIHTKIVCNWGINLGIKMIIWYISLLHVIIEWEAWCCRSTFIEKKNKKNKNVPLLVKIMLWILHQLNQFEQIRDTDNSDIRLISFFKFFTWPHNYINNNKIAIVCNGCFSQ